MGDDSTEQQNLTYGDSHPINPSIGGIGISYGGLGGVPATVGYSWGYNGEQWQEGQSSLTWGNSVVGINSEANEWGWSVRLGPLSLGETYKPDGAYGTATIGLRGVGVTFEVHEDNPTTNMEAGARAFDLLDENGNVVGQERYVPVGSPSSGWAWHVSRVDTLGNPIAETRIIPMDPQTQKQLASGFLNDHCFLADTPIQMWPLDPSIKPRPDGSYDEAFALSKVWEKPISEIKVGDIVVAYDDKGRLGPKRVLRTMTNVATHLLDFWNTGVTPGHAYYCADGKFKDQHVPLMDILRTDGAIMRADGTMIRAATNCEVGSMGDMMIHASATLQKPDGSWTEPKPDKVRFGTRIILPDGVHKSFMEMAHEEGWKVTDDGYMVGMMAGEDGTVTERVFHFPYGYGEALPKPEDYVLSRSAVTLEEIYAAGEWEQIGTRMSAPVGMVELNTNNISTLLQPSKPQPNIPPAFAHHPDAPHHSEPRLMNRKQRKAVETKQLKTTETKMVH